MLTHRFSVNSPASVVFFLWHRLITHPTFFSPLPFAVVFCSSLTVRGCSVAKRVLALWNFRGWKEGPILVGSFAHRSARFLGRRHQIGKTANALTRQAFFFLQHFLYAESVGIRNSYRITDAGIRRVFQEFIIPPNCLHTQCCAIVVRNSRLKNTGQGWICGSRAHLCLRTEPVCLYELSRASHSFKSSYKGDSALTRYRCRRK